MINQTAREFLEAKVGAPEIHKEIWEHSLKPEESNSVLASICVSFLMFNEVQQHSLTLNDFAESESKVAGIIDRCTHDFEFLTYAAEYWTTHLRHTSQYQQHVMLNKTTKLCDTRSPRVMTWYYTYQVAQDHVDMSPWRLTDLLLATTIGSKHLVEHLVSQGADIDVKDDEGATALNRAVAGEDYDVDIIELLLKGGADVEAGDWIPRGRELVDDSGEDYILISISGDGRPLWRAVLDSKLEVIRLLMEFGADMHKRSENVDALGLSDYTPLEFALGKLPSYMESDSADPHRLETVKALFELADVNARFDTKLFVFGSRMSTQRATPLLFAVLENNIAAARLFIVRGADLNAQVFLEYNDSDDEDHEGKLDGNEMWGEDLYRYLGGISTLKVIYFTAADQEGHAMVELLLHHGGFPRAENPGEPIPLHLAASAGNKESVSQLLKYGADIAAKDGGGKSALFKATENRCPDVVR